MDAAGLVSFHQWLIFWGEAAYIYYMGKQINLPSYSPSLFAFNTLLQETVIYFCILLCRTSSCTDKLWISESQIMFSWWLPSQQSCGLTGCVKYKPCVAESSAGWLHDGQPLLQYLLKIMAHCPEIITRKTSNRAVGREVSEINSHHENSWQLCYSFIPHLSCLAEVFTWYQDR